MQGAVAREEIELSFKRYILEKTEAFAHEPMEDVYRVNLLGQMLDRYDELRQKGLSGDAALQRTTADYADIPARMRREGFEEAGAHRTEARWPQMTEEEAADYVKQSDAYARKIAMGTALCSACVAPVMLLVALFNMIAALLIILLERTRMIGVLKTLGMGNGALQKMFVIRSPFIILRGMVWGNLIGIGLCLLQYFTGWITLDEQGYFLTTLPVSIRWGWVLMLNAGTFVLIVVLLSLPTMLISFILPERSIRFE